MEGVDAQLKAIDKSLYNKLRNPFGSNEDVDFAHGQWAVSANLSSSVAWATPGFAEAYRYNSIHGGQDETRNKESQSKSV